MAKLPKFTLIHNNSMGGWDLKKDKTNSTIKHFETKEDAIAGGVLKNAIGGQGSVKIKKMDNSYQEERTYPKSEDPKKSKG